MIKPDPSRSSWGWGSWILPTDHSWSRRRSSILQTLRPGRGWTSWRCRCTSPARRSGWLRFIWDWITAWTGFLVPWRGWRGLGRRIRWHSIWSTHGWLLKWGRWWAGRLFFFCGELGKSDRDQDTCSSTASHERRCSISCNMSRIKQSSTNRNRKLGQGNESVLTIDWASCAGSRRSPEWGK